MQSNSHIEKTSKTQKHDKTGFNDVQKHDKQEYKGKTWKREETLKRQF